LAFLKGPFMRDTVLLLTHSGDLFTIDRVAAALSRRGVRSFRLDTDAFPARVHITSEDPGPGLRARVTDGDATVHTDEIASVWARRLWPPRLDADLDPQHLATCVQETRAALYGFLSILDDRPWVNPMEADRQASCKLRQLRIARDVGLPLPRTCVTNDPARVRRFWDEVEGRMVAKMLTAVCTNMAGDGPVVHTHHVLAEDLDALDDLGHCPMVFQEAVPKEAELRVAMVDGDAFTGLIRAPDRADWRDVGDEADAPLAWEHGAPQPATLDALRRLMDRLGLVYGGVDLVRTPDGREVFLEVNPGGEWGMLERDLDLPISERLAACLARPLERS